MEVNFGTYNGARDVICVGSGLLFLIPMIHCTTQSNSVYVLELVYSLANWSTLKCTVFVK